MSQPLSPYTSTDAVRSCVGITDNEVLDEMLTDQSLGLELELDLKQWVPTYDTLYTTGMAAGAAEEDKIKAAYITLYAQWFLAARILYNMSLAIPQLIGDGKSELRRFQEIDWEALQMSASGRAAHYKAALKDAQGVVADDPISLISRSIPDYDPVAGA